LFGEDEAKPIHVGGAIDDPQHFARQQVKRIHPEDLAWLHDPDRKETRC
jgi:hypothetical protein